MSRILHAGYVFESAETQVLFDPIFENPFSGNCYAFPDVCFDLEQIRQLKPQAVFISHFHDDHCSLESLQHLNRETPIYIYCLHEKLPNLIRSLGFKYVHPLQFDKPIFVGPFEVIPRRALDPEIDSVFHLKVGDLNILNVVDSWLDLGTLDELKKSQWDLVLWPFQPMREIQVLAPSRFLPTAPEIPFEWIEQLKILHPRFVVPSSCQFLQESWSWHNRLMFPITYAQFKAEVEAAIPNTLVHRLDPSRSISMNNITLEASQSLSWVRPVGSQDVDYQFDANLSPSPMREISENFPTLEIAKKNLVEDYCKNGIVKKYEILEPLEEGFFSKTRIWKLSVFGEAGALQHFYYELSGASMTLLTKSPEFVSWLTEIPISRLYLALEEGAALTSLYLRINDCEFSPTVETEVVSADLLEDPLIRCLYQGRFADYQEAQLRRINSLVGLV